ncbi:hypothetical protein V492_04549 [Pseudogymnoascus sp. VKM F-4246]|nr:hypothetical protein V492_04549 [Pseudogymnoascus sp. VKM F-4246]
MPVPRNKKECSSIKSAHHGTSKRAPIPIPRHTRRHALRDRLPPAWWRKRCTAPTTNHRRRGHALTPILAPAGATAAIPAALCAIAAVAAAGPRAARDFPPFVLAPAEFAGAAAVSEGVEGGVLVERDEVRGVRVAEDVAAAAAVVAACEVGEGACA